jgi:hypothetical protein
MLRICHPASNWVRIASSGPETSGPRELERNLQMTSSSARGGLAEGAVGWCWESDGI